MDDFILQMFAQNYIKEIKKLCSETRGSDIHVVVCDQKEVGKYISIQNRHLHSASKPISGIVITFVHT